MGNISKRDYDHRKVDNIPFFFMIKSEFVEK